MTRIAIIDNTTHTLFVEDVNVEELNETYEGNLEEYIKDNYTFDGDYSWNYITSALYIGCVSPDPYDLDEQIDQLRQEDLENEI